MSLASSVETVLFVAGKPLSAISLAKITGDTAENVSAVLTELAAKYNAECGIWLAEANGEWQLVTNPANSAVAEKFVKVEVSGELTRAQLETLTVISYCGPISRPDIEQIRGVNCSVIIRNLMVRGLIEEREEANELVPRYAVTIDYQRHLGLSKVEDLPDYANLHDHQNVRAAFEKPEAPNQ